MMGLDPVAGALATHTMEQKSYSCPHSFLSSARASMGVTYTWRPVCCDADAALTAAFAFAAAAFAFAAAAFVTGAFFLSASATSFSSSSSSSSSSELELESEPEPESEPEESSSSSSSPSESAPFFFVFLPFFFFPLAGSTSCPARFAPSSASSSPLPHASCASSESRSIPKLALISRFLPVSAWR